MMGLSLHLSDNGPISDLVGEEKKALEGAFDFSSKSATFSETFINKNPRQWEYKLDRWGGEPLSIKVCAKSVENLRSYGHSPTRSVFLGTLPL